VLSIFSAFVENLFPQAKIVFLVAPRKNFKFETRLKNQITLQKEMMVDLSRDNIHPGPETIKIITQEVIRKLDE